MKAREIRTERQLLENKKKRQSEAASQGQMFCGSKWTLFEKGFIYSLLTTG